MSKSETIFKAMILLNEHATLLPGTYEYQALSDQISLLIDELGQKKALEQVRRDKALLLQWLDKHRHWNAVEQI
ncbi:hypothetical protein DSCW_53310 [Desulfosarcina widdelii]|uniref:Uncharacterized protein n=1 Tax=Desulfosarcina widdelii TaxID=947919 RepID=A0A5K7ZHW4_9BACT|nr:hypothetical protein [Desulfosarcina widdelii]BBO77914.1 hypothetical protein DSCW_53310 [Desulfosarcina widdelii]